MGLIWLRGRAELRAGWRGLLALALLVAIGGGVALTAIAGARRADTAMPRFLAYSRPSTGTVFFGGNPFIPPPVPGAAAYSEAVPPYARAVIHLPQVSAYFRRLYLFTAATAGNRRLGSVNTLASPDAAMLRTVDRPSVLAGRLPRPAAALAVAVNELAARKLRLHVGSPLKLRAYSARQFAGGQLTGGLNAGRKRPDGPAYTVRVAAIIRLPADVNAVVPLAEQQDVSYEGQQNVYLTPAFVRRLAGDLGIPVQRLPVMNIFSVRLRGGTAGWNAFAAAVSARGGGAAAQKGDVLGTDAAAGSAQRGIHLEVVALAVFGAVAALVTLLLAGQAIARQAELDRGEYATLRSLGAGRAQLFGAVQLRAVLVAVAGGALAAGVAVLCSPLMPIGMARQAEIHPGFEVNLAILVPGAFVLGLLIVARSAVPAWRLSRGEPGAAAGVSRVRPSRVAEALARASAPPAAVVGARFGLEPGRGRSAVPVASAMVAAVAATVALAAAVTFGASLGHLVSTPRQQGWNWDVLAGNPNDSTDREAQARVLLADNGLVRSYSAIADLGATTIQGVPVSTTLAIDPMKGSVYPPLLQGRAPLAPDEIVLGTATLDRLGRRVGQTVRLATPAGAVTMHIVGRMIVPSVGDVFPNGLGDGAWVPGSLVRRVAAQAAANPGGPAPPAFVLFAIRYAPGVPAGAAFASLQRDFGRTVLQHLAAADAINLQSVAGLPFVLAGLVALLGSATLGHTLITSLQRRRRDLAILKTLGFARRQVAAAAACQATALVVVALVIGLPLGVAAGRWAWSFAASGIESASPPQVPAAAVTLIAVAALLAGNAIAAWPGQLAARVAPAAVLRSE